LVPRTRAVRKWRRLLIKAVRFLLQKKTARSLIGVALAAVRFSGAEGVIDSISGGRQIDIQGAQRRASSDRRRNGGSSVRALSRPLRLPFARYFARALLTRGGKPGAKRSRDGVCGSAM